MNNQSDEKYKSPDKVLTIEQLQLGENIRKEDLTYNLQKRLNLGKLVKQMILLLKSILLKYLVLHSRLDSISIILNKSNFTVKTLKKC